MTKEKEKLVSAFDLQDDSVIDGMYERDVYKYLCLIETLKIRKRVTEK